MNFELIEEWKGVLKRSHSMWSQYAALFVLLLPELLFWLYGVDTNPRIFWLAGVGLVAYGIVGRIKKQGIKE